MRRYPIYVIVALAVLAASCKSSRTAVSGSQATPVESTLRPRDRHKTADPKEHAAPAPVAEALMTEARTWLGVPYRYGGHSREGTDCSGFMMELYNSAASLRLPRNSHAQMEACEPVPVDALAAGDLVFFSGSRNDKVSHVGMYIGDGQMIHASSSRGVIVSRITDRYYVDHFRSAGRVAGISGAEPAIVVPADKTYQAPARQLAAAAEASRPVVTVVPAGNPDPAPVAAPAPAPVLLPAPVPASAPDPAQIVMAVITPEPRPGRREASVYTARVISPAEAFAHRRAKNSAPPSVEATRVDTVVTVIEPWLD